MCERLTQVDSRLEVERMANIIGSYGGDVNLRSMSRGPAAAMLLRLIARVEAAEHKHNNNMPQDIRE